MQDFNNQISGFGMVLLFAIGAILFVLMGLLASKILRPSAPNAEKLSPYECGEEPVGTALGQFNIRFYIIALIFILFDVEMVFLFPWATVFGNKELIEKSDGVWGWFALLEMITFVIILAVGLAYAWAKGYLDWIKPQPQIPEIDNAIPEEAYFEYLK